jgi:integrase
VDFRKSIDAKSAAYKRTSRFRLDVFNKQFGRRHIETISTDEVCAFIEARTHKGEPIEQRTRWNWYNLLRTVWIFARKKSWLPSDHPALPEDVPYSKGDGAYSLCTTDNFNKLIQLLQARPDADMLVPYVFLMAYAGIRTEEAKRLTWEDIKSEGQRGGMEQRLTSIEVPRGKGKLKTERRSVNINKTLESKLDSYLHVEFKNEYNEVDYKDRTGPIVSYATADAIVRKVARKAGIPWMHNMLRHTYITHFLRISERLELVADQCGTSVKMIKSNYRELGTLDEAIKWFAYNPTLADEIGIDRPQEVSAKELKAKMGW